MHPIGKSLFVPKIDKLTPGRMDILRVYDSDDLNSLPPGTWGIREPDVSRNGELRQSGAFSIKSIHGVLLLTIKRELVLDDDCDDLDVILVPGGCSLRYVRAVVLNTFSPPGVAFDRALSRLGHGKGYYDRFISSYVASGRKRPALGMHAWIIKPVQIRH